MFDYFFNVFLFSLFAFIIVGLVNIVILLVKIKNTTNKQSKKESTFSFYQELLHEKNFEFSDTKLKASDITTMLQIEHDNSTSFMVVLDFDYKVLHSIEIKNDKINVKKFKIMLLKQKIQNTLELVSYLNTQTCFKVIAFKNVYRDL